MPHISCLDRASDRRSIAAIFALFGGGFLVGEAVGLPGRSVARRLRAIRRTGNLLFPPEKARKAENDESTRSNFVSEITCGMLFWLLGQVAEASKACHQGQVISKPDPSGSARNSHTFGPVRLFQVFVNSSEPNHHALHTSFESSWREMR